MTRRTKAQLLAQWQAWFYRVGEDVPMMTIPNGKEQEHESI